MSILLHAGIVCLAFLAYDWAIACWDSMSILLHAGIVCLAFLAYDWAIACWDSLSILLHPGIACLASLPMIRQVIMVVLTLLM